MKRQFKCRRRLPIRLPSDLVSRIDEEARSRGVSRQAILESAIEDRFSEASQGQRDELIIQRLNRLDARLKITLRNQEIGIEAFGSFIKMWFASTPEIPDHLKGAATTLARERYARFLTRLAESTCNATTLLSELPEGVVLKMKDFYGC